MRRTLITQDEAVIQDGRGVRLRREGEARGNARAALLDTLAGRGIWAIQETDEGAEVEYVTKRPNEWYAAGAYPGWLQIILNDSGAEHARIVEIEEAEQK